MFSLEEEETTEASSVGAGGSGCLKSGPTAQADKAAAHINRSKFKRENGGTVDRNMNDYKYPLLQSLFEHRNVNRAL